MSYEDRTPPQDLDAERAVLGAMLLAPDAIADVIEVLDPSDFYPPAHETLYDAIVALFNAGQPADPVTVANALQEGERLPNGRTRLQQVGGAEYLHTLIADVPMVASANYYAHIVREKGVLRRIAASGQRIQQWAYNAEESADVVLDRAEADLLAAAPKRASEDYIAVGAFIHDTVDEIEALGLSGGVVHGVPTGFYDLDDLTAGLHPGQVIVVAGRPASGKSTLGLDFARAASVHNGLTSVIFSLEMTRQEIGVRLISAEAKVALSNLRNGSVSEFDWGKVAASMPRITGAPMFIDDSPNMTMTEIRAKARRLKHDFDLRLIVIDYLQLMSSGRKVENRQVEVSEFSRQIKLLAKELNLPIVALSQLNRGPEQRSTKRPMLSDLRESGAIEQDADVVILVHRDDMYEQESSRPGEADLIVAKHRNGPTRDVVVAFQGHYSRFVDMARERIPR